MQKRSMQKRLYPGKWSVTGGAVDSGERSIDGLYRECKEEIGINLNPNNVELMMSMKTSNCFLDIYLDKEDIEEKDLKLQKEEVDEVKWLNRDSIRNLINEKETSKSLRLYFNLLCNLIDQKEQ